MIKTMKTTSKELRETAQQLLNLAEELDAKCIKEDPYCHLPRVFSENSMTVPNEILSRANVAQHHLLYLRDAWREGWKPYWANNTDNNYAVLNESGELKIKAHLYQSRWLSFQTRERAEAFLNQFKDLIEQAEELL